MLYQRGLHTLYPRGQAVGLTVKTLGTGLGEVEQELWEYYLYVITNSHLGAQSEQHLCSQQKT